MNLEVCRSMSWLIYRTYPRISWETIKIATFSFKIQPSSGKMKRSEGVGNGGSKMELQGLRLVSVLWH
jgi:hypothetical protein